MTPECVEQNGEAVNGRRAWSLVATRLLVSGLLVSGCGLPAPSRAEPEPLRPEPCASREATPPGTGSPAAPASTKLAYRGEEMADGSVLMTIGDIDAAPAHPDAVRIFDYRAPERSRECDRVEIVTVSGWWCTTTVAPIDVAGEIVVGDASPRAEIGGEGFATECHGPRPGRLRQIYQLERDSWSGWRSYGEVRHTSWTETGRQDSGAVWEPCPRGRVGTYDYQLSVRVEIDEVDVGYSLATSAPIRTDCGTGIS